jgi:hypothetical protein
MSAIKNLLENIHESLDIFRGPHNYKSCQEIADELGCPVDWVNEIVQQRWDERVGNVKIEETV